MGFYSNGTKYGKPYINNQKYNGYINGKKIWSSYPIYYVENSGFVCFYDDCNGDGWGTDFGVNYTAEFKVYDNNGTMLFHKHETEFSASAPCFYIGTKYSGYRVELISCICE